MFTDRGVILMAGRPTSPVPDRYQEAGGYFDMTRAGRELRGAGDERHRRWMWMAA
jgi:hypothetical protein